MDDCLVRTIAGNICNHLLCLRNDFGQRFRLFGNRAAKTPVKILC
jgi:hypothetical protein